MVSCLLQNMQVNNYCLIRLKSSHPRHNMNAKPCAGHVWSKVPRLLPHVKWLKNCLLHAVVAPKEGSLLDDVDPIFRMWVNDSINSASAVTVRQNCTSCRLALEPRRKFPLLCKRSKHFFPSFYLLFLFEICSCNWNCWNWHYLNEQLDLLT